uniref:Synaptobrevin, longin-like domain protein n=1 Tax=Tanacetum cinerariifolium TaxID=118510 RepID=A0A699HM91_TANCI|nr:hypothetical protein [Tanacetum cinerariifolium]
MIGEQQVANEGDAEVNIDNIPAVGVVVKGVVSAADDIVPTAVEEASILSPTPPTPPPQPSQNQPLTSQERMIANMDADVDVTLKDVAAQDVEIDETTDVQGRQAKSQEQIYQIDLEHANKVLSMQDDEVEPAELQEVVEVVTTAKLITEVVTVASATITARKQKEDNIVKRYQALKRKPQTETQARKNMMIYLRNVDGFKMDYFKGMTYDGIHLIFKKHFNSNVAFLQYTKEQMDEEDSRTLKRLSESQEDKSLSAKRTSWNEFSTSMASLVICLSKGQKFNFLKYIFDSLVRNVDSSSKFYMYPRFIQLIIQNQVSDLSTHTTRFISPALTQKVFANMRQVGKGFSGVETPLFKGMLAARQLTEEGLAEEQVQADDAVAAVVQENVAEDSMTKLEIIKLKVRVKRLEKANKVKSLKLRHLRKVGASKRIESSDDMEDVFNQGRMIDDLDKDEGIELVVTTAKLIIDVVTAVSQVSAASATISAAKPSIPAAAPTVVAAYTRSRKGVIIRDPKEELSWKTPAETPKLKDKGKGILIKTPKPMKKKDQIELDAEYERKLHKEINKGHEEINKYIDWDAAINHDEMLRLQHLGSPTPMGVPYTEDEIMAIVRERKQRGHIPGVGRVLPRQGTVIPPPSQSTHSADIVRLKKREKLLTKQVNMFMMLFMSDDKFSQMLTQLESQPEYGGGSGSGGCGDDEPGDDENGGEEEKEEDDS